MSDGLTCSTGSAVAHRVVDVVMGPRTSLYKQANNGGFDACTLHSKAFLDCLNGFSREISKRRFYMDTLVAYRRILGKLTIVYHLVQRYID
ncbi:hypothetical protein C2S51_025510 [Perilla frutescens var. frutescens]|nr:hypothetical protein C2S51_025510 [Perilla frutescens var. frutescens]